MTIPLDWPNEKHDLKSADKIIEKHLNSTGGEPLGVFELDIQLDRSVDLRLSDWIIELQEHFASLYGDEEGDLVTRKVVSRCLHRGEVLH